jgi:MFS family permease
MAKDREDEARAVLMRIRGGDEAAVEAELDGIRAALGVIRTSNPYAKLKEPHVRWAIVIGVSCAIMQQWCGVNAVNGYAQDIFILAGASADQAATDAVYIGVAKLGFVIVALILMDRVGRKPLLLVGCAGMALSLLGLGLTLRLAPTPIPASTGSIATATLILFMAFFEISLGPVLWLLLSELYPVQVKGIAMSAGSTTCWFFTYMVTQTFLPMKEAMGADGVFFLFAAVCVFCFFWILRYVPETKGRTLEEIEELLRAEVSGGGSKAKAVSEGA